MTLIAAICILSVLLYAAGLLPAAFSYKPHTRPNKDSVIPNNHSVYFSIIIPLRNEAARVPALLASLKELEYPQDQLEILFCDDHSEDETVSLLEAGMATLPFSASVIPAAAGRFGKKHALSAGIHSAAHPLIITTDADCLFHPGWVHAVAEGFGHENAGITFSAGPVRYLRNNSDTLLYTYQCMESAMLMALTSRAFRKSKGLMANGANLAFGKELYLQAEQWRQDSDLPGGDDIFLLEAAASLYPGHQQFSAHPHRRVDTLAENSWKQLWHQRSRWASKVRFQADRSGMILQALSGLFSIWYLFVLALLLSGAGFLPALILVLGKMTTDLIIASALLPVCGYELPVAARLACSVIQPAFTCLVALKVLFGKYTWKGRRFSG